MVNRIAVVTPVLDDWTSFAALLAEISNEFAGSNYMFDVCAVDDGSVTAVDLQKIELPQDTCIARIEIVHLALNLGHQRAIAVGLCEVADRADIDTVIVMDSDGEDRPVEIAALLATSREQPGDIVLAGRTKRSEKFAFRLGYSLYRALFRMLTGQGISFGNYSALPIAAVRRLVYMPDLWNNLPASVMRSRLPYRVVPTIRGVRYHGRSRMNLTSLTVHGLSAMSVHTETIFVRVLLGASLVGGLSVMGIIGVALIRFVTDLAIPGWATTVAGDLLIIIFQALVIVVAVGLMMLAGRSSRPIIPIADCRAFVAQREHRQLNHDDRAVA